MICILSIFSFSGVQAQLRISENGNVGVGTYNPSTLFHVSSNIGAWGQNMKSEVVNSNTIALVVKHTYTGWLPYPFRGYGTVSNDNFFVVGAGWMYSQGHYLGSDSTLKKEVNTIDNPITKLMALRGVSYRWKPFVASHTIDSFQHVPNRDSTISDSDFVDSLSSIHDSLVVRDSLAIIDTFSHYGFVAQEVEGAFPGHGMARLMPNGINAVAYNEVIPILVESVKAQQEQIANLNEASPNVSTLQSEIDAQAALIANLQHKDSLKADQIIQLGADTSTLAARINGLRAQNTTHEGILTQLVSDTITLAARINGLRTQNSAQADAISQLQTDNTSLAATISSLQATISTLQSHDTASQAAIAALQSTVTALQSTLTALETRLNNCCPQE